MANSSIAMRTLRGIQQTLPIPLVSPPSKGHETKGVVYTKKWVVELLLDLAGYTADCNLADAVVVEPSAGEGAFLSLIIERLLLSCQRLGRPVSDCKNSIIAFELNEVSAHQA